MESLRGQLLVAGPTLLDPNFRRTVVLVCEHTEEGALGLVVNRATALEVAEAVPELADVLGDGARLWSGGPVQPQSIVLLADFDAEPDDAFADDADNLWGRVLARKGGEYALLARMPPDPSLN